MSNNSYFNYEGLRSAIGEFIRNHENLGRRRSFRRVLEQALGRWSTTPINIVETGCIRKGDVKKLQLDGGSSLIFGWWASITGGHFWTCDISSENMAVCRSWTVPYSLAIDYIVGDSIQFLSTFKGQIHLLYLDSMDTSGHDTRTIELASLHQLREVVVALPRLHKEGFILLDDVPNDFKGGKCKYSAPFLKAQGWEIVFYDSIDHQVLLSRVLPSQRHRLVPTPDPKEEH